MDSQIVKDQRRVFQPTPLELVSPVPSDIDIAQAAHLKPISQVAEELGKIKKRTKVDTAYSIKINENTGNLIDTEE